MKTRREFFKVFAGSCAVLAACVVAPKSLMGKSRSEERLDNLDTWITSDDKGITEMPMPAGSFSELMDPNANRITSGYAQVGDRQEHNITWVKS